MSFDTQERPVKRLKTEKTAVAVVSSKSSSVDLPAEVWAHVCHYLPYSDVKNVAAVSKTMLKQVMPAINRIHLFRPTELHSRQARRLPHVERVYIYCLLQKPNSTIINDRLMMQDDWSLEYSTDAQYRIVPFLAYFPRLRLVFLGAMAYGQGRSRHVWDGCTNTTQRLKSIRVAQGDRGSHEHRTLVRNFCGAFSIGSLSKNFKTIDGLFNQTRAIKLCPSFPFVERRRPNQRKCADCTHVLRTFPSDWLIAARGPFLCIPAQERLQQVVKRGDSKLLKGDKCIRRLMDTGFKQVLDNGRYVDIALANCVMQDITALVELELLDPKSVDPSIVYNGLKRIKKASTKPIQFAERDFKALVAVGFRLEQYILENAGIQLSKAPNRAANGNVPRSFRFGGAGAAEMFNEFREFMADHQAPAAEGEQANGGGGGGEEAEIEVNIHGIGMEHPMYADIFGHVRDMIEQQLGEGDAQRFGDLHEQMMGPGGPVAAAFAGDPAGNPAANPAAGHPAAGDVPDGNLAAANLDGDHIQHGVFGPGIILGGVLGPMGFDGPPRMPGDPGMGPFGPGGLPFQMGQLFGNGGFPLPFPFVRAGAPPGPGAAFPLFARRGGRPDAPPRAPQPPNPQGRGNG